MFKNLFESWWQLAPNEATFLGDRSAVILQRNQPPCHTWIRRKLEKNQTHEGVQAAIVSLRKEIEEGNPYAQRFLQELQQNINGDEINLIK
jgi:hypothetical protein